MKNYRKIHKEAIKNKTHAATFFNVRDITTHGRKHYVTNIEGEYRGWVRADAYHFMLGYALFYNLPK